MLPPGTLRALRGHYDAFADRFKEIVALSGDHLLTEGPVHPDYRLLDLCATALDLITQAAEAAAEHQRGFESGHVWTETEQAATDVAYDRERTLTAAVVRLLKRAGKLKATTPAGVYAKALLVRSSLPGASGLAQSLADDLIACEDLRRTLTWPVMPTGDRR